MTFLLMLFATLLQSPAPAQAPPTGTPEEIAPGLHVIRYAPMPGRGPDGNTTIIEAPDGLIVIDTGRHTLVTDAILTFAKQKQRPIVAIVNTHWHLDHASGNGRLKEVYPKARLYTTTAIDRAIAPGGFLARNWEIAPKMLAETTDPVRREEIQISLATMAAKQHLQPDVPLTKSGSMTLAGKTLDVRVTDKAVSDADVWVYDGASRVAIIGDLITMPVPYFETACPDRWRASLDEVFATPFQTAIPGHGRPMTRDQVDVYRKSLTEFVACVRSDKPAAACGAVWVDSASALIGDDPARRKAVAANMEYYVGYLRPIGGKAPDCLAQ
jgi:glyoxylase-like metal-dependent hydrolase (beta-lactamase superfamily II)